MRHALLALVLLCGTLSLAGCLGDQVSAPSKKADDNKCDRFCQVRRIDVETNGPMGGIIARQYVDGDTRVVVFNPNPSLNTTPTVIASGSWFGVAPVWAPASRAVAYDNRDGGIVVCGTNGAMLSRLTPAGVRAFEPMFGRDANDFAYLRQAEANGAVVIVTGESPDGISLGDYGNPYNCRMARNAPYIVCQASYTQGIILVDRSTGVVKHILDGPAYQPAISPNGTRIAWGERVSHEGATSTFEVRCGELSYNGSISNIRTLATPLAPYRVESPAFNRDGTMIAWVVYDPAEWFDHIAFHSFIDDENPQTIPIATHVTHLDWQ